MTAIAHSSCASYSDRNKIQPQILPIKSRETFQAIALRAEAGRGYVSKVKHGICLKIRVIQPLSRADATVSPNLRRSSAQFQAILIRQSHDNRAVDEPDREERRQKHVDAGAFEHTVWERAKPASPVMSRVARRRAPRSSRGEGDRGGSLSDPKRSGV